MKIAIIDFEDSFTYNIFHSLEKNKNVVVEVFLYSEIDLQKIITFDKIIISPGAETPSEKKFNKIIGYLIENKIPILGICLGFQILGCYFSGYLNKLDTPKHGVQSEIKIEIDDPIFNSINDYFLVGRYHSWEIKLPENNDLIPLAYSNDDKTLMMFKHRFLNIYGIQFHPESILTPTGDDILLNWINL